MKIEKLKDVLPVVAIEYPCRYTVFCQNSPIQILADPDTSIVLANDFSEGDFALLDTYEGVTKKLSMSDEDFWNLPLKRLLFRQDNSRRHSSWLDVYVDLPS